MIDHIEELAEEVGIRLDDFGYGFCDDGEEYVLMEKPFPTFHPAAQRILSLMISLEENEQ